MKHLKWLVLALVVVFATACSGSSKYVTKAEFEPYKVDVQKSGRSVEKWIKEVDPFLQWVYQHYRKLCDTPSCDPPTPPPPPPPPGDWGIEAEMPVPGT